MVLYISRRGRPWNNGTGTEPISVDRSITSMGGIKAEQEGITARVEVDPPGLPSAKALAMQELKPFLKAIADVNRLAILEELSRVDGLNVLDIADRLLLSQPLTSWHLLILKRARLVELTLLGRQHVYRLNRHRLQEYKEMFNEVLSFEF